MIQPLPCQEYIDAVSDWERHGDYPVTSWDPVEAADVVGQVVEDGQVVLHHDDVSVVSHQLADGQGRVQPLKVSRHMIPSMKAEVSSLKSTSTASEGNLL